MKATVGDIEVGYTIAGEGAAVVLIHGLAEERSSWANVQRSLPNYRTYAYDLRGHGETSLGNAEGSLAQLGNDLLGFLEQVSGPAVCVGYSLGGTIVLWAAAERPALVRQAIVAGTSSIVGRRAGEFFEQRIRTLESDIAAFAQDLRSDTAAQLAAEHTQTDAVTMRRLAAVGNGGGYINAARAMKKLVDEPLTPTLLKIKCRVDVIGGEKDAFCPPKAASLLMSGLSSAEYHEIKGAGHLMSIDNPAAYADAIKQSLTRSVST
jgi:pimeloyl-ACP methyl ester carboxylesterase